LTAAFLLAGAGRVIASPWHVPSLPSALLMELFALLVDADADEARALSTARIELRAAFAAGGPAERAMEQHLERRLAHPGEPAPGVTGDPLSHAFADAVHELRAGWYATRGLPPPLRLPLHGDGLARLVRFVPPRSERLARACDGGARDGVPATVSEYLRPLRNPACWAGWRLTLRSVDEWGA
jgi:CHAT domain-containing protein